MLAVSVDRRGFFRVHGKLNPSVQHKSPHRIVTLCFVVTARIHITRAPERAQHAPLAPIPAFGARPAPRPRARALQPTPRARARRLAPHPRRPTDTHQRLARADAVARVDHRPPRARAAPFRVRRHRSQRRTRRHPRVGEPRTRARSPILVRARDRDDARGQHRARDEADRAATTRDVRRFRRPPRHRARVARVARIVVVGSDAGSSPVRPTGTLCMYKQYKILFFRDDRGQETVGPRGARCPMRRGIRARRRRPTAVRARPATRDDGGDHRPSPGRANAGERAPAGTVEEETTPRAE